MHGIFGGYSITGATYAMYLAKDRSVESANNYYGTLTEYDSRRDAYRHIVWSALLAQYYPSISSKHKRLNFAKDVGDANEKCGDNLVDGKEMDYHNNAIGRKIWNDNTGYRKFWGMTIGLKRSSYSKLKSIARDYVNNKSCFIVKTQDLRSFPENQLTTNYSPEQIQAKIKNTPADVPVYILGPIRNGSYLPVSQYDYSDCTSSDLPWETQSVYTFTMFYRTYTFNYTIYAPCVRKTTPACYQL